ncbi:hypothetical protein DK801_25700, partial [Escherichia coli]|nr:hypothetical protein [Escherichia coli]
MSLGSQSVAEHNNSVAIGGGSTTDREYSVSFGTGNTNRQLTHVAAGTEDTDGVNVKQLKDYTGNEIAKNNTVINQNINNAKNESLAYTDQQVTKNNA